MSGKTNSFSEKPEALALAAIALLAALLFFFRLGDRPFRNPDEGRYADVAREMAQSGDWVKPTVFGLGYLRKPPLFYWLTAGSFKLFGESEAAARAVPAFFGWLGVLAVYFFGRRFWDATAARTAALLLATNVWYVQVGRYLVIDAVFSFFLTASLFLFYAALRSPARKAVWSCLFCLFLGLAFLAKGPAAPAIAGLSVLVYLFWTRRWKEIAHPAFFAGVPVFFAVATPWFWAMARREPGFVGFFFWHEHVQRVMSPNFEHQEPWYYYFVVLPVLFLPWTLVTRPWRYARKPAPQDKETDALKFLSVSVGVVLLFYSLSRSKLPTYLLPCLPLLSLIAGSVWKRWRGMLFLPWLALLASASLALPFVMEKVNARYTTKDFAVELRPWLKPEDEVFIFDHPGPFYDFPFYLKRPVKLVGLVGELEYSRGDVKAREVSVSREDFYSRLGGPQRFYVLMRRSDFSEMDPAYRGKLHVLKEDGRKVLATYVPS